MAAQIPRMAVMRSASSPEWCIYYDKAGNVAYGEESVFSPSVKVAVEHYNDKLVHLRFYYSNRYWRGDAGSEFIVATSTKPEEDASKESCTLFEPVVEADGKITLKHVHSGKFVIRQGDTRVALNSFLLNAGRISLVNWDSLVFIPKNVAFKGYNGKYLKGEWIEGYPYLPFSSNHGNGKEAITEVHPMPDGHIRLKSIHFNKFWRRSPNWIWADSGEADTKDKDTLFKAVKVDDKTIAFRNMGNNNFCKPLTTEGKEDCLNAAVSTMAPEALFVVEELVLERKIYNVKYRWEDARVYGEQPLVAGQSTVTNETDLEQSFAVKIGYTETTSYTFTQSYSLALGVKSTIEANLLSFTGVKIEVSATFTGTFTSGETTTKTITVDTTGTVKVPPKSAATVGYVGTQGSFSIPYSYTQVDKSSVDGAFVTTDHVDGMYNGVNGYNFNIRILNTRRL